MTQPSDLGLSPSQLANARGIIAAVKARAWDSKAAVIAIETALTESGMRMIASANVPASQSYPYEQLTWTSDGLGHDHASMGMFQQQTGTAWTPAGYGSAMNQTTMSSPDGWGTPAELMDAEKSTAKFLDALARVDWAHMNNWDAAQAVQRSAFPDGSNYRAADALAQRVVGVLWGEASTDTATAHRLSEEDDDMTPFLIQRGTGRGAIAAVVNNGSALKVVHDVKSVGVYQARGYAGPVVVSEAEFDSYPRVGK